MKVGKYIICLFTLMVASCSDIPTEPDEMLVKEKLQDSLGSKYQIVSIEAQSHENEGSFNEPVIKSKYKFTVALADDYYRVTETVDGILILLKVHDKGEQITGQLATTFKPTYDTSQLVLYIQGFEMAVGTSLTIYDSRKTKYVLQGSDEAHHLLKLKRQQVEAEELLKRQQETAENLRIANERKEIQDFINYVAGEWVSVSPFQQG